MPFAKDTEGLTEARLKRSSSLFSPSRFVFDGYMCFPSHEVQKEPGNKTYGEFLRPAASMSRMFMLEQPHCMAKQRV